jgi:hypothetical protein
VPGSGFSFVEPWNLGTLEPGTLEGSTRLLA